MNLLLLKKSETFDTVIYSYSPEQDEPGIVELNKKTGDIKIIKISKRDQKYNYPYFSKKTVGILHQMWLENNFPDKKYFAWG